MDLSKFKYMKRIILLCIVSQLYMLTISISYNYNPCINALRRRMNMHKSISELSFYAEQLPVKLVHPVTRSSTLNNGHRH